MAFVGDVITTVVLTSPGLEELGWWRSQEWHHPSCSGLPLQTRWGLVNRGRAQGSTQLQKSMGGTWPKRSGE